MTKDRRQKKTNLAALCDWVPWWFAVFVIVFYVPLSVCWQTCRWPLYGLIVSDLTCLKLRLCITHLYNWYYFTGWLGSLAVSKGWVERVKEGAGEVLYVIACFRGPVYLHGKVALGDIPCRFSPPGLLATTASRFVHFIYTQHHSYVKRFMEQRHTFYTWLLIYFMSQFILLCFSLLVSTIVVEKPTHLNPSV
jgi:hypothetical protein